METPGKNCVVAGILYLMLAAFAAATMGLLWFYSPYDFSQFISEMANNWEISLPITVLAVASFALAAYLFVRRKSSLPALVVGVCLALVALAWSVVAVALWVLPTLFVWRARAIHDA
jgi:riboflavin transporter FmnP